MAVSQCSGTQADISIDDWFGRYTIYRGGEEALIAAGVIRGEFVAGLGTWTRALVLEPGGGFTLVRDGKGGKGNYVTNALRERGLYTIQRKRDGNLLVCKYRTRAEERAHEEVRQKAFSDEQREKEIKRASALMEAWPKSADAFRKSGLNHADLTLGMLESKLVDGYEGGFRLTDDAARRFEGLVDEMIELIKTGASSWIRSCGTNTRRRAFETQ